MEKFETKRAIVTLIEKGKLSSDRDNHRRIKQYQEAIAKLPRPLDRTGDNFLVYQNEIQKLRARTKKLRVQRYGFEVFVKEYKQMVPIEWEFHHAPIGPRYHKEFEDMVKGVVNQAIQCIRKERQREPHPTVWFAKFAAQFTSDEKKQKGRVFKKEGEVLRIYVEKNLSSLYTDKKPIEPRKYIGIELEFCAPIKENQFAVKLFKSGVHKFAQLKKDGSLRPQNDETGYELAILLEESNYKKRLKQLINILAEVKAVAIDRRAGLHVHLDMRRRNRDLVYNNLVACQYALLSIVDPRRTDNEFCRIVESRKFPTEFTGEREERYKTINAAAFYKYNTLEVRMHEGSVDFAQISHWVDLLIRVANYDKKIKGDVTKVADLRKRITLDKKLYSYIQDRSCHWQLNNTREAYALRERIRVLAEVEARDAGVRAQTQPDRRGAFERTADEIGPAMQARAVPREQLHTQYEVRVGYAPTPETQPGAIPRLLGLTVDGQGHIVRTANGDVANNLEFPPDMPEPDFGHYDLDNDEQ